MALDRDTLGGLLAQLDRRNGRPDGDDEHTWNLLVQVLLPLVFVLTFVILTSVQAYRDAHDALTGFLGGDGELVELELQQAVIELQRQKLLNALAEVKSAEEKRLRLPAFPTSERVKRQEGALDDPDFAELCQRASQGLADRPSYATSLYLQVLEEAGIEDRSSLTVRRWEERAVSWAHQADELTSDGSRITAGNRRLIHNLVLDFVGGIEQRVVALQVGVVRGLFEDVLAVPDLDELVPGSAALLRELADPATAPRRREELAAELYRRLLRGWRKDLSDGGYELLPESWRTLAA